MPPHNDVVESRSVHGWVSTDLGGFFIHPFNDDLYGLDGIGSGGLAGSRNQSTRDVMLHAHDLCWLGR
jgi:hypothetical protein